MTMTKSEIQILKNPDFIRKIMNYTHEWPADRAVEAWLDTDKKSLDTDELFSIDFELVVKAIMEASQ